MRGLDRVKKYSRSRLDATVRCVVATLSLALAACSRDATGPTPYQGAPCEADVAAAVSRYGQPVATAGDPKDRGTMTFVSEGDTITYTFVGHYDATYWCEVKIQL